MAAKSFREDPRRKLHERLSRQPAVKTPTATQNAIDPQKTAVDPKTQKTVKKEGF